MKLLIFILALFLVQPAWAGRLFDDAASDRAEVDAAVVTVEPFTIFACFRRDAIGATHAIVFNGDKDVPTEYFYLSVSPSDDPMLGARSAADGDASTTIAATLSAGTWYKETGVWAADNARTLYWNGSTNSNATTVDVLNSDRFSIGRNGDSSPANYMSGDIAWVVVWNVALSAAEVSGLESGANPMRIRPISRVAAFPLWAMHSPEINIAGSSFSLTLTGTAATTGGDCPMPPWSM